MRYIPYRMSMDVMLVPGWIAKEVKRHGLNTADLLNFQRIQPIIPMNDLAAFVALQEFGEQVFGAKEVVSGIHGIQAEWHSTAGTAVNKEKLVTLEQLAQSEFTKASVYSRIFSEDVPQETTVAYELVPIGDKAVGVIVYPGFFTVTKKHNYHFEVTREVLKQLHVYEDATLVAGWPITRSYLTQLSRLG